MSNRIIILTRVWKLSTLILGFLTIIFLSIMYKIIPADTADGRTAFVILLISVIFGFVWDIFVFPSITAVKSGLIWGKHFLQTYHLIYFSITIFIFGLMIDSIMTGRSPMGDIFRYLSLICLGWGFIIYFLIPKNSRIIQSIIILPAFLILLIAVGWISMNSLGDKSLLRGLHNGLWLYRINDDIVSYYPFFSLYVIPLFFRLGLNYYTNKILNQD